MKRRIYIDTEFIEETMELISIAIVKESGKEYYAVSNEFNPNNASDWVKENVIKGLSPSRKSLERIREDIIDFLLDTDQPVFVGYFCAYDYVLFSKLFGGFDDYPKSYPMYFIDLKQEMDRISFPKHLKPKNQNEHNALADARNIKELDEVIKKYQFNLTK
jgi:hypothetical protein